MRRSILRVALGASMLLQGLPPLDPSAHADSRPPRYDTNTRMPKLAPDGKKTKVTKFFDGDAQKQFDAIWEYLKQP